MLTAVLDKLHKASPSPWLMAVLGLGLIYSMSQVYLIRAVPSWNSWRTVAAFSLSATSLGILGVMLNRPNFGWGFIVGLALSAEMGMALTARTSVERLANKLRVVLLGLGIIGMLFTVIVPQVATIWLVIPIFIIVLAAEAIGRWQFYAARLQ